MSSESIFDNLWIRGKKMSCNDLYYSIYSYITKFKKIISLKLLHYLLPTLAGWMWSISAMHAKRMGRIKFVHANIHQAVYQGFLKRRFYRLTGVFWLLILIPSSIFEIGMDVSGRKICSKMFEFHKSLIYYTHTFLYLQIMKRLTLTEAFRISRRSMLRKRSWNINSSILGYLYPCVCRSNINLRHSNTWKLKTF